MLSTVVVYYRIVAFLYLTTTSSVYCLNSLPFNVLDFDVNDIFDEHALFIPSNLQQLSNLLNEGNSSITSSSNFTLQSPGSLDLINNTDLNSVLGAMRYHRKQANVLMVRNYLAEQILHNDSLLPKVSIQKRMTLLPSEGNQSINGVFEKAKSDQAINSNLNKNEILATENKTAMARTASKHYTVEPLMKRENNNLNRRQDETLNSNEESIDEDYLEDLDVTGYALNPNPSEYIKYKAPVMSFDQQWPVTAATSNTQLTYPTLLPKIINNKKTGYDHSHSDYGVHYHPSGHSHSSSGYNKKQTKQISLKDVTDITVTTLAFLSFGMFILQVLMCITMNKDDYTDTTLLPLEVTDPSDIPGDEIEEIRRKRRSVTTPNEQILLANEIARRVLYSIDSVISLQNNNDTNRHYWSLCENNRYAKTQTDGQQLWMPVWSLGISWVASRVQNYNSKEATEYSPILKSLKAMANGLGNVNCCAVYGYNCSLKGSNDTDQQPNKSESKKL